MIAELPLLYLNGEDFTGKAEMYYDFMSKRHVISLWSPELEAAQRLVPDVQRGVSLDHVMNNWSKQ